MLKNGTVLEVNAEEGQLLLMKSAGFFLPPTLGDATYTPVDQSTALDQVGHLQLELTRHSPYMQVRGDARRILFGKRDVWEEFEQENPETKKKEKAHRMKDIGTQKYKLELSEDALEGLTWIFYVEMHPAHEPHTTVDVAVNYIWPLAKLAGIEDMLREELGLKTNTRSKWAQKKRDIEIAKTKEAEKKE